jgi:hypothetical protein
MQPRITIKKHAIDPLKVQIFLNDSNKSNSRDSSVGMATSWTTGVRFPEVSRNFTASRPVLGPTLQPSQWLPGVKRPGREADNSPIFNAEVKNGRAIPPLPDSTGGNEHKSVAYFCDWTHCCAPPASSIVVPSSLWYRTSHCHSVRAVCMSMSCIAAPYAR